MQPHWRKAERAFLFLLLLLPLHSYSWTQHAASTDQVTVWTEQRAGKPFRTVRAEAVIALPILPLLQILQDAGAQKNWLPYTHKVEVLQQPTPLQTRVRFETTARWPFAARDAVTLFVVSQPDPNSILIDMRNQPDTFPAQKRVERIQQAEGYWQLTALENCHTRVRYEAGNRWGGTVPQWLVDKMNARIAATALQNLQQWAPAQIRNHSAADFLQEVPAHADCR